MSAPHFSPPLNRDFFVSSALEVAPRLLGAELTIDSGEGPVTVRISEVEAYHGLGSTGPYDGGSHARDRLTERNAVMFGRPGHAYVYLSYGMHYAINLVCAPEGVAAGVLLRAGTIVHGNALARERRQNGRHSPASYVSDRDLARGPGRLARALGVRRDTHNGLDILSAPLALQLSTTAVPARSGPRVGVSGEFGSLAFPWRFWTTDDPSVSAYRPGRNVPNYADVGALATRESACG